MNKVHALAVIALVAAACNNGKKDGASGAATTTSSSASAAATSTATPSLLQSALSLVSGGPFEGEITMTMTNAGKPPETIVYSVKGPKMRFVVPSPRAAGSYTIFDTTAKKMMTVNDAQKSVMVIDLNGPMGAAAASVAKKATVDKTGKSDTVAGYSCEIWKVTEPSGNKADLCVARGLSFPSMGRGAEAWMSELGEGFPLRAVTTEASGGEKSRMEVTKIDKKPLDEKQFDVPADYKTMDMSSMLNGFIKRP